MQVKEGQAAVAGGQHAAPAPLGLAPGGLGQPADAAGAQLAAVPGVRSGAQVPGRLLAAVAGQRDPAGEQVRVDGPRRVKLVEPAGCLARRNCDRLRNHFDQAAVQSKSKSDTADGSQWNIVAGQIDPLKPVAFLEIAQAAANFLPVAKIRIHKVGNSAVGAGSNRLCHESICRCLIPVSDEGDDMHDSRMNPIVIHGQLDESDQFLFEIRSDKDAAVQVGRAHPANGLDVLAVMMECPSLPNGSLIIDFPDASHEVVIELGFPNNYALFLCLLGLVSCFETELLVPPFLEGRNGQDCKIVPLHWILVF